ncbi:hypothetical protein UFOVP146_66 [uncultured Caudovirales phage]|uniref:Glycosyltransferase n=1 Tax=uncultured Caudovirales phage TaxID=2100421 RepID=A0A6J7VP51_9CAUD|nr:hypothetical protein UFOVP146_66 [uncultured Caudovirales phage]
MLPIVVCTVGSRSLSVLQTSVKTYNPDVNLMIFEGFMGNFGDDYNAVMELAFRDHDEIIIANDDIVLTPTSYELLLEDVSYLKNRYPRSLGLVASRADFVRPNQSILSGIEPNIIHTQVVSPLLCYVSKEAFSKVKFPPINWFSDDVMCRDLSALGYQHFISRSYIHHVGSQTVGFDFRNLMDAPKEWIKENRPKYFKEWYES